MCSHIIVISHIPGHKVSFSQILAITHTQRSQILLPRCHIPHYTICYRSGWLHSVLYNGWCGEVDYSRVYCAVLYKQATMYSQIIVISHIPDHKVSFSQILAIIHIQRLLRLLPRCHIPQYTDHHHSGWLHLAISDDILYFTNKQQCVHRLLWYLTLPATRYRFRRFLQ